MDGTTSLGEGGCPNIPSVEFKRSHLPLLPPSSTACVELRLCVPEASVGLKLLEGAVTSYNLPSTVPGGGSGLPDTNLPVL